MAFALVRHFTESSCKLTLEQLVKLFRRPLPDEVGLTAEEYADALARLIPSETLGAVARDTADAAHGSNGDAAPPMVGWDSSGNAGLARSGYSRTHTRAWTVPATESQSAH